MLYIQVVKRVNSKRSHHNFLLSRECHLFNLCVHSSCGAHHFMMYVRQIMLSTFNLHRTWANYISIKLEWRNNSVDSKLSSSPLGDILKWEQPSLPINRRRLARCRFALCPEHGAPGPYPEQGCGQKNQALSVLLSRCASNRRHLCCFLSVAVIHQVSCRLQFSFWSHICTQAQELVEKCSSWSFAFLRQCSWSYVPILVSKPHVCLDFL